MNNLTTHIPSRNEAQKQQCTRPYSAPEIPACQHTERGAADAFAVRASVLHGRRAVLFKH